MNLPIGAHGSRRARSRNNSDHVSAADATLLTKQLPGAALPPLSPLSLQERSIKSVMLAQEEARRLSAAEVSARCAAGGDGHQSTCSRTLASLLPHYLMLFSLQVSTEHILLGLIAEESGSKTGFLGTGMTVRAHGGSWAKSRRLRLGLRACSRPPDQRVAFGL